MTHPPPDPATLRQLVAAHLPVAPDQVRLEPIRTGKHNRSYYVHSARGDAVLRIAPPQEGMLFYERGMMAQEPALHELVRARTRVPVAEIYAYDDSQRLIPASYMLMERLPGRALSEAPHVSRAVHDRAMAQVGEALRQMHALTADAYGYLGAHRPMAPQPTWWAAFRIMWNALLDDVERAGGYTTQETRSLRDLLDAYRDLFDRDVTSSLLHMDVWAQNILIDGRGNLTGLVDLDRALWGDVEIEFAVLDYCGISTPAFWEGYGAPRDESPAAQVRQRFYLLYEVLKYIPIHIWRRDDRTGAQRYAERCAQLAMPLRRSA
ncbi:MAG: aminoglycoside phosphotransferase family protein [Anaerolineae bacterium]|nr:aminoglycoside phosphotransferase family protein [Anaerolineae bacterium]